MSNRYNATRTVTIACHVQIVNEKSVLIEYINENEKRIAVWIPLSQCEAPDTIAVDDEEITIPRWLAEDRNIPTE